MSYGGNIPSAFVAVFVQGQDGTLQSPVFPTYSSYDIPKPVEVVDVNLDGLADVVTLHSGWQRVGVYRQNNGTLGSYSLYTSRSAAHPLALKDWPSETLIRIIYRTCSWRTATMVLSSYITHQLFQPHSIRSAQLLGQSISLSHQPSDGNPALGTTKL